MSAGDGRSSRRDSAAVRLRMLNEATGNSRQVRAHTVTHCRKHVPRLVDSCHADFIGRRSLANFCCTDVTQGVFKLAIFCAKSLSLLRCQCTAVILAPRGGGLQLCSAFVRLSLPQTDCNQTGAMDGLRRSALPVGSLAHKVLVPK